MMKYDLFLDDLRSPNIKAYPKDSSITIVRNYEEFCKVIDHYSMPISISFDHDLGQEKTGLDCAKYLIDYMLNNDIEIFPEYSVHSANPCGKENIIGLIESFKRSLIKDEERVC